MIMNREEAVKTAINHINSPIVIEREMLKRFIYEMYEQLWEPKDFSCIDLYFAFVDANIGYKMMNKNFNPNFFKIWTDKK